MDYQIVRLTDKPEMKEEAAQWFHKKMEYSIKGIFRQYGRLPYIKE